MIGYTVVALASMFGADTEVTHSSVSGTIAVQLVLGWCDPKSLQRQIGYSIHPTYVGDNIRVDLPARAQARVVPCGKFLESIDYVWSYWANDRHGEAGVRVATLYIHCNSGAVARYEVALAPGSGNDGVRIADFGEVPRCVDD